VSNKDAKDKILSQVEVVDAFREEFLKEALKRVKQKTPVLTGRLQAGWKGELTAEEIRINNDVPYAGFVEYGTDRMAPRGMLRATVLETPEITRLAAKRAQRKAKK
jgi:hypothetical protein